MSDFRPGRPELDRPFREHRSHPPLRWMPLRVMNPWQKLGFIVGEWLAMRGLAVVLGLALPSAAVVVVVSAVNAVAIVAMARSFRGAEEAVEPSRAWWRLTARPRAGWWLAFLYLPWQLVDVVVRPREAAPVTAADLFGMAVATLLAAAFLNSSIRLTRQRRKEFPRRNAGETKLVR